MCFLFAVFVYLTSYFYLKGLFEFAEPYRISLRFSKLFRTLFVKQFYATDKRANLLASKGGVVFVHVMIFRNRAKIIGSGDKRDFGNTLVEEWLTFAEVEHIVSAQRHSAHDIALFYCFVIDVVHDFVAGVDDFNVYGIGLRVHAVYVLPFRASEMFDGATRNRF